jgi:hypothetical protein
MDAALKALRAGHRIAAQVFVREDPRKRFD